ncbi:late secretory pathway protein AVL9 homolog [Tachypleus tridentatus]|uniref:late secretory pathway protein AVL9 homolog n=1 Tax=Tachypleus tridentatus TaxID=6853 RepID=UPI003FD5FBC0
MSGLENNPVLHVVVVGFHHKKGCQVDYSYPPLLKGQPFDSSELPECWKHLPSLALPDGAHNCEKETIYFHLPSVDCPQQTVYGISCYRQMNAERLLNRSLDITRGTVQKSVCVLSRLPLYGLIQTKLELITHVYFNERDFSKVALLEETYKNLNSLLSPDLVWGSQVFLGLSARDLILTFKHKTLILFKLLMLERKVLFYNTGVKDLCSVVLTLCSLFPGMIEKGLEEAAHVNMKRLSPDLRTIQEGDYLEVHYEDTEAHLGPSYDPALQSLDKEEKKNELNGNQRDSWPQDLPSLYSQNTSMSLIRDTPLISEGCNFTEPSLSNRDVWEDADNQNCLQYLNCHGNESQEELEPDSRDKSTKDILSGTEYFDQCCSTSSMELNGRSDCTDSVDQDALDVHGSKVVMEDESLLKEIDEALTSLSLNHSTTDIYDDHKDLGETEESVVKSSSQTERNGVLKLGMTYPQDVSTEDSVSVNSETSLLDETMKNNDYKSVSLTSLISLELDSCGLPLEIFKKGSLCHPYLSLPFLDHLADVNIRNFVIGANNVLFKQKKHLFDVIVEIEESKVEVFDADLRKQLHLTTEDLRFADYLVKHVSEEKNDVFLDGTGWEGGDEWVRAQFKLYLLSLLRTAQLEDANKETENFNSCFVMAWKTTNNYRKWKSGNYLGVLEVNPVHPFHGQLSVSDMKLRLSHTMQSSEKGRKLNQAVMSTGKVVGGAWTSAKSMMSSWWSSFGAPSQDLVTKSPVYSEPNLVTKNYQDEDESQHSKDLKSKIPDSVDDN